MYDEKVWSKAIASSAVLIEVANRPYGLWSAHAHWLQGDEMFGVLFEYKYRMKYPIPTHLPQRAMKAIAFFAAVYPETFDSEISEPELWEINLWCRLE